MSDSLSYKVKIAKVKTASSSGQTAINSDPVDMSDWDGVVFLAIAITGGGMQSLKAQQDAEVGMGAAADIADTGVAVSHDADNRALELELKRPRERFVRAVVRRATQDSASTEIYAVQYGPRTVAETIAGEKWEVPAEGGA